jgi:hypothetical protein
VTTMSDDTISELARLSYAAGIVPVDYAEYLIMLVLEVHRTVEELQVPDADVSAGALARRILGSLLDAGWTPPGGVR